MIGSLRHRITLQQNFPSRIKGVRQDAWGNVATVWARVEPLRGSEVTAASQKEGRERHKVTMRFRPHLTEQFQFLNGDTFEFLDGEMFLFTGLTEAFQFLDGAEFEYIDGSTFNLIEVPDGPPGRFRIKFGARIFDIRDVHQLYPHDEFTVVEVEAAA